MRKDTVRRDEKMRMVVVFLLAIAVTLKRNSRRKETAPSRTRSSRPRERNYGPRTRRREALGRARGTAGR
eukprot:1096905-Prymnesium_polylepis.1